MRRPEILICALLAGMLAPFGPVLAQSAAPGTFSPPPGCSGWLTVQSRGCRVSNHYRCEADAPGDQWRADFDQEGIFFVSRIDRETQWVESFDMFPTTRQVLLPDPADPASFSTLLSTGIDTFDFGLSVDDGSQSVVRGFDRLTGRSVIIDGVTLEETEYDYTETAPDGTIAHKARGNEYIHRDWRIFLSGISEWESPDGVLPVDGTPREFIFPGEPGFFTTEPIFDCDATMSALDGEADLLPAMVRK
jgi:hypothetical protein